MVESTPAVSVLMPVRDAARTLGVALRSTLRSRGVALEVVCVDHRSADASPALLARFAARDPRVRVIDGAEAPTVADALALGRAACRAPLVARMDADDVMHPERLAADVAWLRARPETAAVACRVKLTPRGRTTPGLRAYVAWQNACLTADDHAREVWIEQPVCQPAVTFRASALDAAGGYRFEAGAPEDYALFLRMAVQGMRIEKRVEVHHAWRQHAATVTRFSRDELARLKARAMVQRFGLAARDVVIAGAGKEGARIARALALQGVRPRAFFDIAARRIGRTRHGVPVLDARALGPLRAGAREDLGGLEVRAPFVVAAVGTSGARGVVRAQLAGAGFTELEDAVVVA